MGYKIYNDGGCIRIDKGSQPLFINKIQVKTIGIIRDNVIRIDIGEGPLRDIFLHYNEVEFPATGQVLDLALRLRSMIPNLSRTEPNND